MDLSRTGDMNYGSFKNKGYKLWIFQEEGDTNYGSFKNRGYKLWIFQEEGDMNYRSFRDSCNNTYLSFLSITAWQRL